MGTTPTGEQIHATEISDRTTGNELKVNADGSINIVGGGGGGGGAIADVFGTATAITAATTFVGVPTISQLQANSFVLLANPNDMATFLAEILIASAFVGTLSFYGLEPDAATLQLINAHQRNTTNNANSIAINAVAALNQVWMGSVADFKAVYVVCTSFTSGSASVDLGLTAAPYGMAILNTVSAILTTGAAIALTSPPVTTNAGSDTPLSCASQAKHFLIQNNSAANANIELDATATSGSTLLVPGSTWRDDIPVTVIHVLTAAAQNVNGASGIIVKVWA